MNRVESERRVARILYAALIAGVAFLLFAAVAHGQDRIAARFDAGMKAVAAAQAATTDPEAREAWLDEAIAAFRAILVDEPGLVRVRLELARAFFLKGEDGLARRHFEQVLAGKPPAAVAANIQRFLSIMRARRRWEARFGAALAPDSNLNAASGGRTILLDTPFGRLPFTLDQDASRKSGIGLSLWGGGEYQYPLSPVLRLRAGADASAREYEGRVFDRQSLQAHIGPRRLLDARTEASLLATVSRQWTAGTPEADRFGVRLEAEHRATPRLVLFGGLSAARHNCRDCNERDGPAGDLLLGASWAALPILRIGGRASLDWTRANAEHWRHAGRRLGLDAALALPFGFTLGARASMHWTDFQGRGAAHHTIDRKPREDETRTLSLSVHNRALTVLGFSPRVSLVNEKRKTNAQLLSYSRNRGELSFVRLF